MSVVKNEQTKLVAYSLAGLGGGLWTTKVSIPPFDDFGLHELWQDSIYTVVALALLSAAVLYLRKLTE